VTHRFLRRAIFFKIGNACSSTGWNHEVLAITDAMQGILTLRGENSTQQIVLSADRLRSGSILYSPTGEEIDIGLEVRGVGHAAAKGVVDTAASNAGCNPDFTFRSFCDPKF
jgi:hypothetical protein